MRSHRSSRLVHWTFACLLLAACAPESSDPDPDNGSADDDADDDTDGDTSSAGGGGKDGGKDGSKDGGKADAAKPPARDGSSPSEGDGGAEPEADAQSDDEEDGSASVDDMASLLPFKEGNRWTYRVAGGTGMSMKVTTVGPLEKVGGMGPNKDKMAFKVTTMKGSDKTVSWQAVEGTSVLRYREVAYSAMTGMAELEEHWVPSKLHIHSAPEFKKAGHKWVEMYQETKTMTGMAPVTDTAADNWSVDGVDVSVTVPAGTFKAVVFVKASPSGQKTYWYVPGVGKVKETGGQTEELASFEIK
jgi:hypothetical protein